MRMTFSRSLTPPVLVTLLIIGAACQPTPTPTSATPGAGLGGAQEEADPNGGIVMTLFQEPFTIDPHKASLFWELDVVTNVFENLMALDPATLMPVPAAAAAPPEISSDGKRFLFTLRDGLKFSDGTPLTAQDFEYGYARSCDPRTAGRNSSVLFLIAGCEDFNRMSAAEIPAELDAARAKLGVKALDAKRIEFTTIEAAPHFTLVTTMSSGMPVRRADVEAGGASWTEPATYIGNGPFKLVKWEHNQSITFERNEHYRLPVKLKTWRFVMIGDRPVEFAAYRNNQLDLAGLTPADLRTVEADPALKAQVVDVPGKCAWSLGFNMTKPPFQDPLVRLAFARSLDRATFVKDILSGMGRPAQGFIPTGYPGYDPSDDAQAFDVRAAERALAESSYGSAGALPRISYSFWTTAENRTRAEWARQQWKANLGVDVDLEPLDNPTYQRLILESGTAPQVFLAGYCGSPHQRNWLSTGWSTGGLLANPTGYSNAEFDRVVTAANASLDPNRAADLYLEAARTLSRDVPAAWVHYDVLKVLVKPWVRGIQPTSRGVAALNKHEIHVVKH